MINVLIIEDDGLWQSKIIAMLDEIDIKKISCVENATQAINFLENNKVDLIITDILLENETVFKVFEHKSSFWLIPTVILTVSDKEMHYKQTHRFKKALYLVKPVNKLTLRSAIENICEQFNKKQLTEQTIELKGSRNERFKLPLSHILFVEQKGNYCHIKTAQKDFVLKKSLTKLILELDENFLQIHRSYCINTTHIEGFKNNLETVKIIGGYELPIGRINNLNVRKYLADKYLKSNN
ncbi:MAG: LytR/AlgR family response regulator transcription factor [Chitinophagaceae bacterium]